MTSIGDLVNTIERDFIVPIARPEVDTLAASYSAVSTTGTVQLSYTETLLPGAVLDCGFELMYVFNWNSNSRNATVKRAYLGTTAAAGTSGDFVRINPRFPSAAILDCVTDELRSWDSRLFRIEREELSFGAGVMDAAATPSVAPWRVAAAQKRPISTGTILGYYEDRTNVSVRLTQSEDTTEFSTGYGVHLTEPFAYATVVDVFYALPFDLTGLSSSSNLESTHGLSTGMLEILKWGAIWRLMAGRETNRADVTTHARPDLQQANPAGVLLQEGQSYKKLRDEAYDREYRKLLERWPMRFQL